MSDFEDGFDQREQIRDAIDIVDLVERYVPLRRQGANFVGKCPWHDDSRPSLQVNATRQTFKCWVCNIGGDVFSFVMRIENVDFRESMQILADMAGIELKKFKPNSSLRGKRASRLAYEQDPGLDGDYQNSSPSSEAPHTSATTQQNYVPNAISRPTLYRAMEWLAGKYRDAFLHSPEAENARQYVRDRGITEKSAELFQIGYSPLEFDAVMNWIRADRNRVRTLEVAGVLAYRDEHDERGRVMPRPSFPQTPRLCDAEQRKYYDRFRGRLIFPIRDVQDRVVAFGGRLLPDTPIKSHAKYVNSPETPIFHKSKMLYGLDRARVAIRQTNLVLVTEGYTDCIVTSQFGFENVVAVLGTALGAEHVRILKRFASKMILLLDGDEAGQKRAKEVLRFFVEQGVDMSVLTLPDDDDPCEFLLEKGPEPFRELIQNRAVDALDHAFNTATAGVDLDNDVVGAAKALDSLLDVVALFPDDRRHANDPVRLRMIGALQRFATRFRVSDAELRRQLAEKRAQARSYAERVKIREERFERRREEETLQNNDPRQTDESSPELKIERFRKDWVYPVAGPDNENDEQLRALYPPFEASLWNDPRFMPSDLEREYLEFWLSSPDVYPQLVAKIANDDLRSPIARQLDLVARDCLERGETPSFARIVLRYEDETMKSYLIALDDGGIAKKLPEVAANPSRRAALVRELADGFERLRNEREIPKKIVLLREKNATPEQRLQTLLELRRQQQEKQRKLAEQDYPDDSDVPS